MDLDTYYELKDRVEDALRVAEMFSANRGIVISLRACKQEIINTMANSLTGSTGWQEVDENGNVINVLKAWELGEDGLNEVCK